MNLTTWEAVLALPASPTRDHIRGSVNAPVTLLEYGDYACPYCRMAHSIVGAVQSRSGSGLRFVFRHFPLTTIHPHAEPAAEAAEAAGAQGEFWAMHDTLFRNQQQLDTTFLLTSAEAIGLDLELFGSDLAGHVHAPKVREDFMSGVRSGVNGTPCFYINGLRHNGSWDFEALISAVQTAARVASG